MTPEEATKGAAITAAAADMRRRAFTPFQGAVAGFLEAEARRCFLGWSWVSDHAYAIAAAHTAQLSLPGSLDAERRVGEFCRQRAGHRGLDPDLITTSYTDPVGEPAELRLSDLVSMFVTLVETETALGHVLLQLGSLRHAHSVYEASNERVEAGRELADAVDRALGAVLDTAAYGGPMDEQTEHHSGTLNLTGEGNGPKPPPAPVPDPESGDSTE